MVNFEYKASMEGPNTFLFDMHKISQKMNDLSINICNLVGREKEA